MSATESKIKLIFDGVDRVSAIAKKVQAGLKGLSDENSKISKSFGAFEKAGDKAGAALLNIGKGIAVLGAAGGAVNVIGATVGALAQLAPIALVLPGALLAGAAAMTTFKIATAGFGDALKAGLSGDMAKFAEATKKMAPAMQEAAKAVVAFRPQIDALKKSVQQNFWSKFSGDIKKLGDHLLPTLTGGLSRISAGLGQMVKDAIAVASTKLFRGQLASILVSTGATIENMRPALGNVLAGFVSIGKVGAEFLPRLGTAISEVTAKFKAWATSTEGQNQIKKFIDGAIQGFKDLIGIVQNVGSILGSIFDGLGTSMASPLATLKELTGELAAFLKTAEAQEGLKALGEILSAAGSAMKEIFLAAVKELLPTIKELAPGIKAVIEGFKDFALDLIAVVGPALRDVGKFMNEHKDAIHDLIPIIGAAVLAFKGFKILTSVAGWFRDAKAAVKLFGDVMPGVGKKAEDAGKKAEGAGKKLKGLTLIKAGLWAAAFVGAIDAVIGAIEGYTKAQDDAFAKGNFLEDLQTFAEEFDVDPFKAIGKEIVASLTPPAETVELARKWAAIVDPIATQVGERLELVKGEFKELPPDIGKSLNDLGTVIQSTANGAMTKLNIEVEGGFGRTREIVAGVPQSIVTALSPLAGLLGTTASTAVSTFAANARAGFDAATAYTKVVPGLMNQALATLAGLLGNTAVAATDRFKAGTKAGFDAAVAGTKPVPGQINAALSGLSGQLGTTGATAGSTFNSRLSGALNQAAGAARAATAGIAGAISGALSGLGAVGAAAGAAVGAGLVRGLNAQRSAVAGAAAGLGATVAANKGPLPKDRKMLIPAGIALVQGLIAGMSSQLGTLAGFSSAIGPGIASAIGTSGLGSVNVSAPGAGVAALPQFQVAPQIRVFIGDTELTHIVRTEVDTSNRATRRTVTAGAGTTF